MLDGLELQEVWNRSHDEKPVSEKSEDSIIGFANYLQKQFPEKSSLLDVGCGRGRYALYLSQLGFSVWACDLSPIAIKTVRKHAQQASLSIDCQVCDLACLPYADNSFPIAICVHVLPYHIKAKIANGIRELWRVMQLGGWLYVDFLDCDDVEYGYGQKLEEHTFLDADGVPIHFSSQEEIHELLSNFTLEHVNRHRFKSTSTGFRVTWKIWATKC